MTNTFDIDLEYGHVGEKQLANILSSCKIEVKTERDIWKSTGNIAIEYKSRGKFSGIAITEADYWATILKDGDKIASIILTPVPILRALYVKYLYTGRMVLGGDNKTSEIVLIPINEILKGGI
jgi:hypothetical protein